MNVIDDLPIEILRKIFRHCVVEDIENRESFVSRFRFSNASTDINGFPIASTKVQTRDIRDWTSQEPWTLARVSRAWKLIALSLPELWAQVTIHPNEDDTYGDNPLLIELINEQINPAGTHPLSVFIVVIHVDLAQSPWLPVIHKLFQRSAQFLALTLIFDSEATSEIPSFSNLSFSFPQLKHLCLLNSEPSPFRFSDTPQLKTIDICGVMPSFVPDLPLFQIEEFVSVFPFASTTLPVLDHLTSMKECTIACLYEPDEIPTQVRTLQNLTSLSLYAQIYEVHAELIQPSPETDPIAQFLRYLTLHALNSLELIGPINVDVLVSFQDRSSCPLKNLA
ncbi:hypothetical protein C8J56DRAFT_932522 [Mycena floridula]|nr:hypothetical protein C8J56DRAFT_932522 [Mycena floridula]